jgi:hypothetical protein
LVDKLMVVVPSTGCKIVGVAMIIIIRRAVVIGKSFLWIIQYCRLALHSCCHHILPVNMVVRTPVFATKAIKTEIFLKKTSFHFLVLLSHNNIKARRSVPCRKFLVPLLPNREYESWTEHYIDAYYTKLIYQWQSIIWRCRRVIRSWSSSYPPVWVSIVNVFLSNPSGMQYFW